MKTQVDIVSTSFSSLPPWKRTRDSDYLNVYRPLSVWVRVHMNESTLPRALTSVYSQVFSNDLNVNIVLHGCSDSSPLIARAFLKSYPSNTTIYEREKVGDEDVGQSFRELLFHSNNSDWFCFLPGDDYWLQGKVALHKEIMNRFPEADYYFHSTLVVKKQGQTNFQRDENTFPLKSTTQDLSSLQVQRLARADLIEFRETHFVGIESSLFHSRLLTGLTNEMINHPQGDLVFDYLTLKEAQNIYAINTPFAVYEVGRHASGWNTQLFSNAHFDNVVTTRNVCFLSRTVDHSHDDHDIRRWARTLRSRLVLGFVFRRGFGRAQLAIGGPDIHRLVMKRHIIYLAIIATCSCFRLNHLVIRAYRFSQRLIHQ